MKRLVNVLMVIILIFGMAGCGLDDVSANTHKTYRYTVDTGDEIDIRLDTTGGYDISSAVPFEISKDGKVCSTGTFITASDCEAYVSVIKEDDMAEIIDSGEKDTISYYMWAYNDSEFNYVIMIKDSGTGIILGNNVSEDTAKEIFDRLEISLIE